MYRSPVREGKHMDIEEFVKFVEQNIKSHLPGEYQDAVIRMFTMTKINKGEVHGLSISGEGEKAGTVHYLDDLYKIFASGSQDMFQIMESLADKIIQNEKSAVLEKVQNLYGSVSDYDSVRQNLLMRLCDRDTNQAYLRNHIYTEEGDFAITYHVVLEKDKTGIVSTPVTEPMLEMWGVTREELHQDALRSDLPQNKPILCRVEEQIKSMQGTAPGLQTNYLQRNSLPEMQEGEINLFILTNEELMDGAAMIAHRDVLEKAGELIGGDYYVLPSSIHEVMIIPSNGQSAAGLQGMVHEINQTEVDVEDRLSDKVQYYDTTAHVLENALAREERLEKTPEKKDALPEKLNGLDREDKSGTLQEFPERAEAEAKNRATKIQSKGKELSIRL